MNIESVKTEQRHQAGLKKLLKEGSKRFRNRRVHVKGACDFIPLITHQHQPPYNPKFLGHIENERKKKNMKRRGLEIDKLL